MNRLLFILLIACLNSHFLSGSENTALSLLTAKGKAGYNIVIAPNASEGEIFAANELKRFLFRIFNQDFQVSNTCKRKSIVVSTVSSASAYRHIRNLALKEDSYAVIVNDKRIYLVGSSPRSTLYAVYDFLEQLGYKWVAPDFDFYSDTNESILLKSDSTFNHEGNRIEEPAFQYRKFYVEEGRSHTLENLKKLIDWMPKARMNILVFPIDYEGRGEVKWSKWREELTPELKKRDILIEVGGHGYQNFIHALMEDGTLYEKHPEWFGLDTSGTRSNHPRMVFCTSNTDAANYLYINVFNYLKSHPEIDIFDFWPPDSETWCSCDHCVRLGTETERHILLVNRVATLLQHDFPQVRLECLSYNRYTKPSEQVQLNSKVLLDFCPIGQNFEHQIFDKGNTRNEQYHQDLLNWKKVFDGDISIYTYFRKYAWRSLPNIIPNYMQQDIQYYKSLGIHGLSVYSEPGDWFTYGLNHYVFTQLAWNPAIPVDSLTRIYADQVYGQSGSVAFSIYKELEDIVRFACNIAHTELKTPEVYKAYQQRIEKCRQLLSEQVVRQSDYNIKQNIIRLDLMLTYASKSISFMISKATGDSELTKQSDTEIRLFLREHANKGIFIPHRYM